MKRVQFSHVLVFSDSRNVRKSVTQIIYLSPLRRGPHSWTDIFLSTPVAADFGTGPEAGRRGAQLDEEFCCTPLATDFCPGPDGGAGGRRVCFSTLLAANFEPGLDGAVEGCAALAWSLPFYLSLPGLSSLVPIPSNLKTVDQTLPPWRDGEGRRFYCVSWTWLVVHKKSICAYMYMSPVKLLMFCDSNNYDKKIL